MVKELQYERIAQLIAVSAINRNDSIIDRFSVKGIVDGMSSDGIPEKRILIVKFSSYVKSQIHLCIVSDLYGRSILDYVDAAKYLNGYKAYVKSAERVLHYFYEDMSRFLINNPYNLVFQVLVDVDFPSINVDVKTVKEEFESLLGSVDTDRLYLEMATFRYSFIIDNLDNTRSLDDARAKIDSYVVAAILKEQAQREDTCALKLQDWR